MLRHPVHLELPPSSRKMSPKAAERGGGGLACTNDVSRCDIALHQRCYRTCQKRCHVLPLQGMHALESGNDSTILGHNLIIPPSCLQIFFLQIFTLSAMKENEIREGASDLFLRGRIFVRRGSPCSRRTIMRIVGTVCVKNGGHRSRLPTVCADGASSFIWNRDSFSELGLKGSTGPEIILCNRFGGICYCCS